jgi:hypothetical protein
MFAWRSLDPNLTAQVIRKLFGVASGEAARDRGEHSPTGQVTSRPITLIDNGSRSKVGQPLRRSYFSEHNGRKSER